TPLQASAQQDRGGRCAAGVRQAWGRPAAGLRQAHGGIVAGPLWNRGGGAAAPHRHPRTTEKPPRFAGIAGGTAWDRAQTYLMQGGAMSGSEQPMGLTTKPGPAAADRPATPRMRPATRDKVTRTLQARRM